jgi:hypothetical protein
MRELKMQRSVFEKKRGLHRLMDGGICEELLSLYRPQGELLYGSNFPPHTKRLCEVLGRGIIDKEQWTAVYVTSWYVTVGFRMSTE